MKFIPIFVLVLFSACTHKTAIKQQKNDSLPVAHATEENVLLSDINQLTFAGIRSGEGYFSQDGSQYIFQSERLAGNPFYQIYQMDMDTGDVKMVSNGIGKTTCAWFHPNGEAILFSSTHLDPDAKQKQIAEIEFRASGKERRYAWDYDEKYEIFVKTADIYQQITNQLGYDAEASFSPDGKLILFASNRNGYTENLSEIERKKFAVDPAYMMDIYIMQADGSDVKQLTQTRGYDGGPFFSPDGKQIVWRRFSENGLTADIYTMNVDGSNEQRLTKVNNMSWAPFYHPSQKYIIFTSNKYGFSNFELFIVATKGLKPVVRVTNLDGFDGLPAFTPDGKQLYWTRKIDNNNKSQVYRADWNHQLALKQLKLD